MENEKKNDLVKNIFLVFGILFSIVLVPALILGIPIGGAAIGLSVTVSEEQVERVVEESGISGQLYDILMEELAKEVPAEDGLRQEYWESMLNSSITVENIEEVIAEAITGMYNGTQPNVDVSGIAAGFREGIDEIARNGFSDLYAAWEEGTPSKYFTDEFVQEFCSEVEKDILNDYSEYGATSLEDLETKYDSYYGAGAFETLIDDMKAEAETRWGEEFSVDADIVGMVDEIEVEINDAIYETAQNPDVREVFDLFRIMGENSNTIKLFAYGMVLAAVVLLLAMYWFGTAGFVVPAVALLLGGGICKLIAMAETDVLKYLKTEIAAEPDLAGTEALLGDLLDGVLTPFFAEVSKFGLTNMGIAVLLILLAILRGVIRKNKQVAQV